jgi:hypothetical protein
LKLAGSNRQQWQGRAHFFGAAADPAANTQWLTGSPTLSIRFLQETAEAGCYAVAIVHVERNT